MNNNYLIKCSRCGKEMRITDRCCIYCGNLNPNHPDNENTYNVLYQTQGVTKKDLEKIKSGELLLEQQKSKNNAFSIFNAIYFIFLILQIVGLFSLYYIEKSNSINFDTSFIYLYILMAFGIVLLWFVLLCDQLIFMKSGNKWWYALIPIYSSFKLCELALGSGWFILLGCIPGVNFIYYILYAYNMGRKFGKNAILTVLFFPIMYPIIALGKSRYSI